MSMENPQLKEDIKEINQEGWEDNAAVRIDKKENMPNIVKALETEGQAEDVGTYIRLHKQILIPAEDFKRLNDQLHLDGKIEPKKGGLSLRSYEGYRERKIDIFFFDKNLNLAKISIDPKENKIASLMNEAPSFPSNPSSYMRELENELEKLGFDMHTVSMNAKDLLMSPGSVLWEYSLEQGAAAKNKKSEEFDF